MALRNIFTAGNLPEGLSVAGENSLAKWQPTKFIALILANLASLVETTRAAHKTPIAGVVGDVHAPSVNTAAVVTYAAVTGTTHAITGIAWSYSGTTTTGNIKIKDGTAVIFDMDVPVGNGSITFPAPKKATAGNLLSVTAAAGGSGSTGKVSVLNHFTA